MSREPPNELFPHMIADRLLIAVLPIELDLLHAGHERSRRRSTNSRLYCGHFSGLAAASRSIRSRVSRRLTPASLVFEPDESAMRLAITLQFKTNSSSAP